MIIRYSDGREFDTSGEYRIVEQGDLYVVGHGLFAKVEDRADGERFIAVLKGEQEL